MTDFECFRDIPPTPPRRIPVLIRDYDPTADAVLKDIRAAIEQLPGAHTVSLPEDVARLLGIEE